MPTERQIEETISRCVSIMIYHHHVERRGASKAQMIAEVQLVAGWVEEMALMSDDVEDRIFRQVRIELFMRFEHEVAQRLIGVFVEAFDDLKMAHAVTVTTN